MKVLIVCGAVLLTSVTLHSQKARWGQEHAKPGVNYPILVHVYGIHLREDCSDGNCFHPVFADVMSSGRKIELEYADDVPKNAVSLSIGDFHARILKGGSGFDLGDGYELLMPDNRVLRCGVSGMTE